MIRIEQRPERRPGTRAAIVSSSSYSSGWPSSAQSRRHDWSSHSPAMFFRRRVVPETPPSFVKFSSRARGVITGAGTSVPSSDQVPELRNARWLSARTAATAEPVSWHAGATTRVPRSEGGASLAIFPTIVPGSTIRGSSRVGSSSSRIRSVAQDRVRASTNCVVVALVYSAVISPVSQKFTRSGIVPNELAASTSRGVDRHAA